jgi:hypothetical protein
MKKPDVCFAGIRFSKERLRCIDPQVYFLFEGLGKGSYKEAGLMIRFDKKRRRAVYE